MGPEREDGAPGENGGRQPGHHRGGIGSSDDFNLVRGMDFIHDDELREEVQRLIEEENKRRKD
jgi:hypothetical protein